MGTFAGMSMCMCVCKCPLRFETCLAFAKFDFLVFYALHGLCVIFYMYEFLLFFCIVKYIEPNVAWGIALQENGILLVVVVKWLPAPAHIHARDVKTCFTANWFFATKPSIFMSRGTLLCQHNCQVIHIASKSAYFCCCFYKI